MSDTPLTFAIVGAGLGGLTAASNEIIHRGKKLVGLDERGSRVTLTFEGGDTADADVAVEADGVHSIVRDLIIGPDAPIHKGCQAISRANTWMRGGNNDTSWLYGYDNSAS